MPQIPGVKETFTKLTKLHEKKNDDYAGEQGPFFNFDFAKYLSALFTNARDKVYAVIIGVKIARLVVLLNRGGKASNESVEDTFDDLIVYATIWKSDYVRSKKADEQD
jgi:hypothetical protein